MPPELLNRDQINADPAADIWAMGVIFYMVLFDRYPFEGEGDILTKNIIANKWKLPEANYEPSSKVISSLAADLLGRMLT